MNPAIFRRAGQARGEGEEDGTKNLRGVERQIVANWQRVGRQSFAHAMACGSAHGQDSGYRCRHHFTLVRHTML